MSTGKSPKKPVEKPFDAKHLKAAKAAVEDYEIVLHHEEGEWVARGVELYTCIGSGATPDAAVKDCREVMVAHLAFMAEDGDPFPATMREVKRTEQVNLRMTMREKTILERMSVASGFRSMSDFIRSAALDKAQILKTA